MDTFLTIASKRDSRTFADRPLDPDDERVILDAGRLAGSARNGQPWSFVVARSEAARRALANAVYRPELILECAVAVLVCVRRSGRLYDFDAGRAAQNMMLAAWSRGIVSCPNGIARPDQLNAALGIDGDLRSVTALSFGRPLRARDALRYSPDDWSRRAQRRPMAEVVLER